MAVSAGLRLLEEVRALVGQGWSRGADARDLSGRPVDPWARSAVCWSLLGALVAVLEREAVANGEMPLEQVASALYALADVIQVESLEDWNDHMAGSQHDVLQVLDRTIGAYAGV